jgi:hypothetical protein
MGLSVALIADDLSGRAATMLLATNSITAYRLS